MLADADQTVEQTVADSVDTTALKGSAQTFLVWSTLKIPNYCQITLYISSETLVILNYTERLIEYLSIK